MRQKDDYRANAGDDAIDHQRLQHRRSCQACTDHITQGAKGPLDRVHQRGSPAVDRLEQQIHHCRKYGQTKDTMGQPAIEALTEAFPGIRRAPFGGGHNRIRPAISFHGDRRRIVHVGGKVAARCFELSIELLTHAVRRWHAQIGNQLARFKVSERAGLTQLHQTAGGLLQLFRKSKGKLR